ncbi:butyrophilin subfamily 1 member A1-like [Lepus europaeus]|uniref:butyrophilin subfamily 1 member A1-like n=1 Tax=Lepus europaeus TaxID=9983 RepID=UPI002B49F4BD|nr:butyrophilin subfamily 1 member A1-like [Lepus europaeus]
MEHGCRPSLLCSLPSLLLLAQLLTWGSADEFQVIGPSIPIVAELPGNATLPCYLAPPMNAEDMELRWFRTKFSEEVFVYRNRREQNEEQMPQYAGRTSLVRDLLTHGEAAVHIQKVQASDNGSYTCFFQKGGRYAEAILELQVAGLGSAPQVHIEGPEQDGVRVVCKASGWFPKPQVQWTDLSGKKFLEFSEAHAQDAAGLFSVEAALVVRDSSAGSVSCSVLNPILGQEKAMAVSIPAWRKAQLYADWRKELFQACSAHQTLAVSPERKSVTCQTTPEGLDDIYSVLGLEGITSGRCYWEVEISKGESGDWVLGVCHIHIKVRIIISPPVPPQSLSSSRSQHLVITTSSAEHGLGGAFTGNTSVHVLYSQRHQSTEPFPKCPCHKFSKNLSANSSAIPSHYWPQL